MSIYLRNFVRYLILVAIQVLLLNKLSLRWWASPGVIPAFVPFIYPLFILLMPLSTPIGFMLIASFLMGLSIDAFMDTGGMHAAACVLMAYLRMNILTTLLPRKVSDYGMITPSPKNMGWGIFLTYAALLLLFHHLFYFIIEIWTFRSIGFMLMKVLVTLITSMIFVILYSLLFSSAIVKSD